MRKKIESKILSAELKRQRERSRVMQKRALIATVITIAATLLGFSFGLEENGSQYDKQNQFPAVYGMSLSGNGGDTAGVCTAVLVHPQLLVTAAHCVYDFTVTNISNAPNINGGTRKYSNPKYSTPVLHPTYKKLRPGLRPAHPSLMNSDFAYIFLKKPVLDVAPIAIKSIHDLPDGLQEYMGKNVITTGYGVTVSRGSGGDYSEDAKGYKRFGSSQISGLSAKMITMAGLKGNMLPGDSGGPLFLQENGQTYVIGLNQSIAHNSAGGAYSESHAIGLTNELVCWASKSSGIAIAGVNCP